MSAAFTPGPWKVVIDSTLTGAWAEVSQECVDPETNEPWDRELFCSETTHVRKADCYPPNGTFRDVNEAPDEWELTEDGEEHIANANLIAAAPDYAAAAELLLKWFDGSGSSISGRWERIPHTERHEIVDAFRAARRKAGGEA